MRPEPPAAGEQLPSGAELWDGEGTCFWAPCAHCHRSNGAEHPGAGAVPREVALPLLFGIPSPCPAGPQLFPPHGARVHCVRPESLIKQNVYACLCSDEHLGWLARSLLSAAGPAALGHEPQLPEGLRKGLYDVNFRSLLAFSWSPHSRTPLLSPCAPSSATRGFGCRGRWLPCNPVVPKGAAGPFEGLQQGGHVCFFSPGGVDTHPMNALPLSHLSRV